jgi:diguanylate cyclase (GGDEF)-like protein/PAS domain S-box-containing protein
MEILAPTISRPVAAAGGRIYQKLVESISQLAVYLLDPDGLIANPSLGGEQITGFRGSEIISAHIACFYTAEERNADAPRRALMEAAERGSHVAEGWRLRKDGSRFWALTTIDALRGSGGALVGYAFLMRDTSQRRAADRALAEREELFAAIVKHAPAGLFLFDIDTLRFVEFNDLACANLGYDRETFAKLSLTDIQAELSPMDVRRRVDQVVLEGIGRFELRHRRASGKIRDVEVSERAVTIRDRRYMVGFWSDITERKAAETMLRNREQQIRSLVEHTPDGIVRYDRGLRRIFINEAMRQFLPEDHNRFAGAVLDEGSSIIELDKYRDALKEVFETGESRALECRYLRGDGEVGWIDIRLVPEVGRNWNESHGVSTVLAISRDITERVRHNEVVARLAFTDSLTELPNRALFGDRMNQLHADASRYRRTFAVMLIDVDHFKDVNDSLGHKAGDVLLAEVARRFATAVRKSDTLARIGGDEFAVLLPTRGDAESIAQAVQKLLGTLDEPIQVNGKEIFVTVSVGVSIYPLDSLNLEDLTGYADAALYQAKREGRNSLRFYTSALTEAATDRLAIGTALRGALSRGELELYYQPKVRFADNQLIGAEALLRWRHPELGLLFPDKFIQVAEDTGVIVPIGEWVIETACRAACDWNSGRETPLRIAVNLSPRQFVLNDLAGKVSDILDRTGAKGAWLEFELTESMLLNDSSETQDTLARLHHLGITIAIDDFGTGQSALAYFNRFEIDVLKIDRAFITDIDRVPRKAELVKAFLSLATALGLETVAEGVETPEQSHLLADLGCAVSQGFLHSRPVERAAFEALYAELSLGIECASGETAR